MIYRALHYTPSAKGQERHPDAIFRQQVRVEFDKLAAFLTENPNAPEVRAIVEGRGFVLKLEPLPADFKPPPTGQTFYIKTMLTGAGYAAVMIVRDPDGFEDIQQTGIGRFKTEKPAIVEAKIWAQAEGLEYRA